MKFRILCNGIWYKVQGKKFILWHDMVDELRGFACWGWHRRDSYSTFADAFEGIKKKWGQHADIVRNWEVVNS